MTPTQYLGIAAILAGVLLLGIVWRTVRGNRLPKARNLYEVQRAARNDSARIAATFQAPAKKGLHSRRHTVVAYRDFTERTH